LQSEHICPRVPHAVSLGIWQTPFVSQQPEGQTVEQGSDEAQ